ncbi:uncharacterized protein [Drosophila suzukii]|uniref:Integrase catalytic domain-containing protein n=1 Tax=Drosophila suzukii TaxID=28584 RepID=A0ABM4TU35_DROSZ
MEQLKSLVKSRARLKANITRVLAWAEHTEIATHTEITTRIDLLNEVWKEFNQFSDCIALHEEVEGYVDPEIDNAVYEAKYLRASAILKERSNDLQPGTSTSGASGSNGLHSHNDAILNLLQQNQQLFERLAHLSNTQKFHHLKTLLVDEAANSIRHLAITDTAYNTAWERLKERYNRPRHIVNSFLEQFMSLPTTTKIDATVLRKVSDGANEIVRGLDAVNQTGRDCWIIYLALEKLDADTRRRWIERSMETDSPTLEEFFKFLDSRCEELELSKRELATGSKTSTHPEKPKRITQSMVAVESSGCTKCSSTEHTLYGCQQFLDMSGLQRRSFVKEKSLCYNCLRPGHGVNRCRSTYKCRQCKGNHHSLLHVQPNTQASGNLAQIAEGDEQNLSASNTNSVTLSHVAQGAGTQKVAESPHLWSANISTLEVFKDLQLADTHFNANTPVDILLGSEHVWSVFTGRKMYSVFGWVITSLITSNASNAIALTTTTDIDNTLQKFWELENVQSNTKLEPGDDQVEKHFLATHSRDENGKYIVELPFNTESPEFGETLQGALKRFKSVERRLQQNEQLRTQYVYFMREYINLGHMREVPPEEIATGNHFFLPHHPVLGRKLRVVFDGSFRDANGKALNDTLFTGPSIQRDLFAVCLRFRMYKFAFSADIVKMFRQIWVNEKHRNYQKIVWREDSSDPIKHFQLCTETYGTSCAPFLAVRVLEQLAVDHQDEFPNASKILLEDFYVDDVLTGSNNEDELRRNRDELIQLMSITHDCLSCFRQRHHTAQQQMADLPSVRVTQALPFVNTGCDYAGPIFLKDAKVRKPRISKGYICLFVCMVTSAIHLELVTDLTTETFLAALRRFISLRGKCSKIYSDNGTNFIGAKRSLNEMQELLASQRHKDIVTSTLADDGIQWVLIPPRAPHWGGKWESAVRCVKLHLRRVTGNSTLTFEQMRTLLAQISAVINSRPLCYTSDTEDNYLSPAHFLIGRPLTTVPDPDLSHIPVGRLGYWQSIQAMLQGFWKKWHQEYLTTLQQRPKLTTLTPNLSIDDVVLVKESNTPPASWHIARVMETYPGKDNLVRAVKLKTSTGEMTRPITKIAVLPSSETVFQGGPGCS